MAACAVVAVSSAFLEHFPAARADLGPPGQYFGSLVVPNHHRFPDGFDLVDELPHYAAGEVYRLLAFDEWIGNPDRKAGDVLRITLSTQPLRYRLVAIDHANAFTGGNWTIENLAAADTVIACRKLDLSVAPGREPGARRG